jgi:ribokinase
MLRVAVVGHVEWVEFVEVPRMPAPGDILGAQSAFARAGGGGGVVAPVLVDLGAEVDFFCALGDDGPGHAAAEELSRRGVRLQVAWRSEPTRRAVTLLAGGERTIVTIGERLAPHGDDRLDWGRLEGADGVYFTAGDVAALERARAAGVVVASPRGREALSDGPTVDALVYSGSDHDERRWARRLANRARLLVETRGGQGGAWRGESEGEWAAAPLPGPARDTYGCGDSFAAAFTFSLSAGETVADAAALGAEWGAHALAHDGPP